MASIVLIFSHPLLGHLEATVQTHLVGQSRNLWNVGGHGLGILTSKGFRFDCRVGRDRVCARQKPPCSLARAQHEVGRRLHWKEPP